MSTINYHYKSKTNINPKTNALFECSCCKKTYKNKLNYDKHSIICELLHDKNTILSYFEDLDEDSNLNLERNTTTHPTQNPSKNTSPNINNCLLIELMKSLLKKYNKLSNEMTEIKKWIHKEKKQLNILDWLNNNDNNFYPNTSFDDYINNFPFSEEYIKKIIHNNIQEVYLKYIEDTFSNELEDISEYKYDSETKITIPICCFNQKPNIFYIYTDVEIIDNKTQNSQKIQLQNNLSTFQWREATREDLIKLFGKIKNKFISELCNWYEYQQNHENHENHENNPNKLQYQYNSYQYNSKSKEKLDEIFNKSVLKLMTDISNSNLFQKLKNKLYFKLKIDIKQYIEYDFNFTSTSTH